MQGRVINQGKKMPRQEKAKGRKSKENGRKKGVLLKHLYVRVFIHTSPTFSVELNSEVFVSTLVGELGTLLDSWEHVVPEYKSKVI